MEKTYDETIVEGVVDYSSMLDTLNVKYIPSEYYWQVGEIIKTQGWIIHLSVIRMQVAKLLNIIVPELIAANLPFKIVRDSDTAAALVSGNLGSIHLNKIVCIYSDDDFQLSQIAKKMISITSGLRGARIPTDRNLGGIVYTRYGSFSPIISRGQNDQPIKMIYDHKGQLITDPYSIPFKLPFGITWPFKEIVESNEQNPAKLLNYSYYPISILKPDAKGDVIRALYFRRFGQIRSCLIKQGRLNMFADNAGRDIQDRLKWQYELYQNLGNHISMPEIYEYFNINEDSYLAMEFIKGMSLASWISLCYYDRCWKHMSNASKLKLLNPLQKIITIIQQLHSLGYIHRDITPENFLIDKNKKIYLIDMELTWCIKTGSPNPPFRLGTPGFMSPEQEETLVPTIKEDVYGLGGLLVFIFTNLHPMKFKDHSKARLKQNLYFFTNDQPISNMIAECLDTNPDKRPSLLTIQSVVENYHSQLIKSNEGADINEYEEAIKEEEIKGTIQSAISGLAALDTITLTNCWLSKIQRKEDLIGNEQSEMAIYTGWHTGLAGPLYTLAIAKQFGFKTDACKHVFIGSWDYIQNYYFSEKKALPQGLYTGTAGIGLALSEGLNSGILLSDTEAIERIAQCFSSISPTYDLASGVSGQGIAVMKVAQWLGKDHTNYLLSAYVKRLIESQQKDGSWRTLTENKKDTFYTGFANGMSGIIWFLLNYLTHENNNQVRETVNRGLNWLIKKAIKKKSSYSWPITTHNDTIDDISFFDGVPGIILTFIKAHEILKNLQYREIAENCLKAYPPCPVTKDFTLNTGLIGLGELYLEAYRVFGTAIWKKRANWIVALLIHTFNINSKELGYWQTDGTNIVTADLFTGSSGIIQFLLRYKNRENLNHPLSIVRNQEMLKT